MEFFEARSRSTQVISVMPIGDIQYEAGGGAAAIDLLKKRIAYGLKHQALFLGTGDYIDYFSPSNRERLTGARLYDTGKNFIDGQVAGLVQELFDVALRQTVGRWIGLLAGHHYHEFQDGTTSDMMLCDLLGAQFLGTSAFGRVSFPSQDYVTIWATHGTGGGSRTSAPLNKLETVASYWEADIFIMGHMNKLATAPMNRCYVHWNGEEPELMHRKIQLVGAGSFAKGYQERTRRGKVPFGHYTEHRMLSPLTLGNPMIRIHPEWKTISRGKKAQTARIWAPNIIVET